jgi:hypothetical protein
MDNKYPAGFRIYQPSANAPTFIKGNVDVDVTEFTAYLNGNHRNGKVRFQLKESREGKLYMQLDTYVSPKEKNIETIKENINETLGVKVDTIEYPDEDINPEDIPFN